MSILINAFRSHRPLTRSCIPKRQGGAATLVVTIVLMIAIFLSTAYMGDVVVSSLQISANEKRSKEAFHAAQAGIDHGFAYMQANVAAASAALTSPAGAAVTYAVSVVNSDDVVTIDSTGVSPDGSVQRTLSVRIGALPSTTAPPDVPIVAKGFVNMGGNVTVTNNENDLTIWSGEDLTIGTSGGTSFETRINIDGNRDQVSTSKSTRGSDVAENDRNLLDADPADFLEAFFGEGFDSLAKIGAGAPKVDLDAGEKFYKSNTGTYFWDGDLDIGTNDVTSSTLDASVDFDDYNPSVTTAYNGTDYLSGNHKIIGTPDDPVILVVDGTFELGGSVIIFGTVVADKVIKNGSGTTEIYGGIISLSEVEVSAGGLEVKMDSIVNDNNTQPPGWGVVSSTWKDW